MLKYIYTTYILCKNY